MALRGQLERRTGAPYAKAALVTECWPGEAGGGSPQEEMAELSLAGGPRLGLAGGGVWVRWHGGGVVRRDREGRFKDLMVQ